MCISHLLRCFSVFLCGILLYGCQTVTEYSLSESMINHYLKRTTGNDQSNYSLSEDLDISVKLSDYETDIGRIDKQSVVIAATANVIVSSLIGSQEIKTRFSVQGFPEYVVTPKTKNGAIYLRNITLINNDVITSTGTLNSENFSHYLKEALQLYFNNRPIYVLDKSSELEEISITNKSVILTEEKGRFVFSWSKI